MHDLRQGRVLVTGGAGFIGSALVWALNRRGIDDILISDYLGRDDKFKNLVPLRFADYMEANELQREMREGSLRLSSIRTVLHLGACSSTTERDAAYLVRNNYEFTKELAAWSLDHRARFVYASSAATYGDGAQGMSDSADLDSLRPLNMYGYSKQLFDCWARREDVLDRMVGLKYFNVFGPNEDHKGDMRSLVHKSYSQVLETGSIKLFKSYKPEYEDGEQMRDFLYVKDAVEMTIHLAEDADARGLYNIGSGRANTWNALARAVFKALGQAPSIEYVDMPESLRSKYQYFTQADVSKLRAGGYAQAAMPLEDAVGDYVKNYLATGSRLGDAPAELAL